MKKMHGILCTSLTPNNLSLQNKAVSSWREIGFDVISVNCEEEISQLNGQVPNVDFISMGRDSRKKHGKPLIYLDDALAALTTTKASIYGIINADIILSAPGLTTKLKEGIKGKCFFGNRIEVQKIDETVGSRNMLGYDFFIFDPELPARIPASNFCLGMPWWDYWLPLSSLLTGFSNVYIDSRIAFHQSHTINWHNDTFYQYGFHARELIAKFIKKDRGKTFKQQFDKFIKIHFANNIKKRQHALQGLDICQTDRLTLPPFAEALCAFIRHSASKICLDI